MADTKITLLTEDTAPAATDVTVTVDDTLGVPVTKKVQWANIVTAIGKAAASGLASLNASSLVVQNPANATATPTASKIPIADAAGTLAGWGNKSRVRAYLDTAVQAIATATWTKILLNAEEYDGLDEFDPVTNYRFTASAAGYYLVLGAVNLQTPVDQQWAIVDVRKNNVSTGQVTMAASGTKNISPPALNILYLAATNYLELWFYHDAGVSKNVGYGAEVTWFCVHRLS